MNTVILNRNSLGLGFVLGLMLGAITGMSETPLLPTVLSPVLGVVLGFLGSKNSAETKPKVNQVKSKNLNSKLAFFTLLISGVWLGAIGGSFLRQSPTVEKIIGFNPLLKSYKSEFCNSIRVCQYDDTEDQELLKEIATIGNAPLEVIVQRTKPSYLVEVLKEKCQCKD